PLEYRLTFPYDPDFAQRYKDATSHALIDFAHSFPPDDGSGDWFYSAIAKVCDLGRHGAISYAGQELHRSGFTPFMAMGIKPPQMTFWMARFRGYTNLMAMLNYDIRNRPDITNYTSIAMDMAKGDTDPHWTTADFTSMQYHGPNFQYTPNAGFGEVPTPWTRNAVYPTLPLMTVPLLFDRAWTAEFITNRKKLGAPYPWFYGLYAAANQPTWMKLLKVSDVGPLPAGDSDLLRTLFNVLAWRGNQSTIFTLSGVSPSVQVPGQAEADMTAYNKIRFAAYTIPDDQMIWDVMDKDAGENVPGYVQRRLNEPGVVDFLYDPYPVQEKFVDVLKRELRKVNFVYTT
ncbi:MAG: hypothetical protein KDE31_23915, partial [Caldilineaceae bacterium]|nr:hypothetical protein [Caldilineaceae bacterium]